MNPPRLSRALSKNIRTLLDPLMTKNLFSLCRRSAPVRPFVVKTLSFCLDKSPFLRYTGI